MTTEKQPTCDKCHGLLSPIEAAGRETGTCNDCLVKRVKRHEAQQVRFAARMRASGHVWCDVCNCWEKSTVPSEARS